VLRYALVSVPALTTFLERLASLIWAYPVVGLCLLSAGFFTLKLRFVQLRGLPHAIALLRGKYDRPGEQGEISHFQALSAALSGTVGIGNIAGVAIAIAMGGPGAVLWMWVIAFFGMAAKFAECTLATHYREADPETGEMRGGPMYYIQRGLGPRWRPMAVFAAGLIALAAFGFTGMFQSNQAAEALHSYYAVPRWLTGLALAALVGAVILGGIKRIGRVAARIVPLMFLVYLGGALLICLFNLERLPWVLATIVSDGFSGEAAAGGSVGAVVILGVRRAIFSNEAGLGSAGIAHAAVKTDHPVREGIVASLGPFIDTIVVCSATASIIMLSGNFGTEMYRPVEGRTIGFEAGATRAPLGAGWRIGSEAVPDESPGLRQFREGGKALAWDARTGGGAATLAPLPLSGAGLRFSYYRESGGLKMRLLGEGDAVLARARLPAGVGTGTPRNDPIGIETQGCSSSGVWRSCALLLTGVGDLPEARLQFLPDGAGSRGWIDRVQPIERVEGIALTIASFDELLAGFGSWFVSFAGLLFAFSTMITWSYYGETAARFLGGRRVVVPYKVAFVILVFVGAVQRLDLVLNFSDVLIGLLVIPNAIALLSLSGQTSRMTVEYFEKLRRGFDAPGAALGDPSDPASP